VRVVAQSHGRRVAELVDAPCFARPGRLRWLKRTWSCPEPAWGTVKQWREAFLAYFATAGANLGGTEAINGLIELHRRVARGLRNRENYRLRMLLIGGRLGL
jgi:transposase